jgi:CO dehydrogenase/acetyl-CoA synthase alpha subunit
MEKDCYKEIIEEEVSKKLAEKVCSEENGLAARATMIDQDVQSLVQEIGRKATKNILESTRDEVVTKKNPKD